MFIVYSDECLGWMVDPSTWLRVGAGELERVRMRTSFKSREGDGTREAGDLQAVRGSVSSLDMELAREYAAANGGG